MLPRAFIPLAVGMAAIFLTPCASAQTLQDQDNAYENGESGQVRDRDDAWRDDTRRPDRADVSGGDADFAQDAVRIRSALDAGLAQGWLDHDDFLIFARQLRQTELQEERERRIHGGALPGREGTLIAGDLDELRRQLDGARRQR